MVSLEEGKDQPVVSSEETGSTIEAEQEKPEVFLVYGHHATNEAIAKNITPRLEHSAVVRRTRLNLVEQPEGLCYVDAYLTARQKTDPKSPEFSRIYSQERTRRLEEGYRLPYKIARDNPRATVIDVHETPGGVDFEDEGIIINIFGFSEEEKRRLKNQLREILPHGSGERYEDFPIHISGEETIALSGRKVKPPRNYAILELLTNPELYEKIASQQEAKVKHSARELEIRRLKRPRGSLLSRRALTHEETKYARILELVVPELAEFMAQKRNH